MGYGSWTSYTTNLATKVQGYLDSRTVYQHAPGNTGSGAESTPVCRGGVLCSHSLLETIFDPLCHFPKARDFIFMFNGGLRLPCRQHSANSSWTQIHQILSHAGLESERWMLRTWPVNVLEDVFLAAGQGKSLPQRHALGIKDLSRSGWA